jgi:hypothetical protein
MISIKVACKTHPKYKALRAPKCDCSGCIELWRFRSRIALAARNHKILSDEFNYDAMGALDVQFHTVQVS